MRNSSQVLFYDTCKFFHGILILTSLLYGTHCLPHAIYRFGSPTLVIQHWSAMHLPLHLWSWIHVCQKMAKQYSWLLNNSYSQKLVWDWLIDAPCQLHTQTTHTQWSLWLYGVSASLSSHFRRQSSQLIFTFCLVLTSSNYLSSHLLSSLLWFSQIFILHT